MGRYKGPEYTWMKRAVLPVAEDGMSLGLVWSVRRAAEVLDRPKSYHEQCIHHQHARMFPRCCAAF
jgi:hypothetical protein